MQTFPAVLAVFWITCASASAETDIQDVMQRLQDLESREKVYISTISEMKHMLLLQDERIRQIEDSSAKKDRHTEALDAKIYSLQEDLDDYKTRLAVAERELEILNNPGKHEHHPDSDNPKITADNNEQEQPNKETTQVASPFEEKGKSTLRKSRFVVEPEIPVAFHAVMAIHDKAHIGINQHIVFEDELLNLGNAYHKLHGTFIAPISGIYVFSVSIMTSVDPYPEVQASVMKNTTELARVFGHGDNGRHDQGSVTVTVQLDVNDEVWVELIYPADDTIYGGRFTSFTGFLLFAL